MSKHNRSRQKRIYDAEVSSADVVVLGGPNADAQANDVLVLDVAAQFGAAAKPIVFKRSAIPKPNQPDKLVELIKQARAQTYARKIYRKYADYVLDGFRLRGSKEVIAAMHRLKLGKVLHNMVFNIASLGWIVAYKSEADPKNPSLTTLHNVTVKRNVAGGEIVYLNLENDAKKAIRENSKFYPSYWSKELDNSVGINITRQYNGEKLAQGGAYFVSLDDDSENIYPIAPMYSALATVLDGESILASLGAVIPNIHPVVYQLKLGNKDGQDVRDGRPRVIAPARLKSVVETFSAALKTGIFAGPSDIALDKHTADENVYKPHLEAVKHYKNAFQAEVGVPNFDEAKSEGVAAFIARGFLPELDFMRTHILESLFLRPLLTDVSGDLGFNIEDVRITWGLQGVHELGTLINRMKAMLATGAVSVETLNESLDYNYDLETEMELKKGNQKYSKFMGMLWEPGQGMAGLAQSSNPNAPAKKVGGDTGDPNAAANTNQDPGGAPPK